MGVEEAFGITLPIARARFAGRVGDGDEEGPMGIQVGRCHAKTWTGGTLQRQPAPNQMLGQSH